MRNVPILDIHSSTLIHRNGVVFKGKTDKTAQEVSTLYKTSPLKLNVKNEGSEHVNSSGDSLIVREKPETVVSLPDAKIQGVPKRQGFIFSSKKSGQVDSSSQVKKPKQEFDLKSLDPKKTYIGLMYSDNFMATPIKWFSKQYCEGSDIPMHSFALSNEDGKWWLYEANLRLKYGNSEGESGVYRVEANNWDHFNRKNEIKYELFELPFDKDALNEHIGEKYGTGDIFKLFKAFIFNNNGKQSDAPGLICSEYLALCTDEVCSYFNLPAWSITPAHFKEYFIKKGLKPVSSTYNVA